MDIASSLTQLKAGKLRVLAVATQDRSSLLPDVPTIAESGVAHFDLSGWIGLFAPAGTPRPIVDRLNAEISKILLTPAVRNQLAEIGAEPLPMSSTDFGAWVQSEVTKWTTLAKAAGLQPE